jgi:hypothetical protein
MSDTAFVDPNMGPFQFGTDSLGNAFTAAAAPEDIFGGVTNIGGTNLDSGGQSAIDLSTSDIGGLNPGGTIPGVGFDPTTGAPPTKPDVPSTSTSWLGSALDAIGKSASAATAWATSPFQTSVAPATATPAVGVKGSQTSLQSRINSLFGTGSPASGLSATAGSARTNSNLLLYGGLALFAFALIKRR